MYETTAWRISCERGRMKWTETYYSATEESARAMIEFTYPGVVIHSIEPAPERVTWTRDWRGVA
jgi:hypothetical protein